MTNTKVIQGATDRAGFNVKFARVPLADDAQVVWSQSGRMPSGGTLRLESDTVQSKDINTVSASPADASAQFTTGTERRTIGVTLTLGGDLDGVSWWLNAELEASTDKAGGERVFRSKVRPKVAWSTWTPAAELSRDEFDSLVKSLPGGWWKSKTKTKAGERYVLRLRVDPVQGEVVAASTLVK